MSSSTATYDSSNLIFQNSSSTSSSSSTSTTSNLDLSTYQNRNQNALQRRAQQLRRWREIEEIEQQQQQQQQNQCDQKNKRTTTSTTKVCFSPSTLFLSACSQRDIDECERLLMLKELKDNGGVNVTNCDGLTALHQACIDDNEQMVRWLLNKSADINCKDNEGWTPLHASANCGNQNIVKILINNTKCDLFALNCDNELSCDVCETKECEDLIREKMNLALNYDQRTKIFMKKNFNSSQRFGLQTFNKKSIDDSGDDKNIDDDDDDDDEDKNEEIYKELRQQELKAIDYDIDTWIESKNNSSTSSLSKFDIRNELERTRDKLSGATIIHVCAAKGYQQSLEKFLINFSKCIDLDSFRDCDGYTALHAAAFWRQPETFEILLKFGANPDLMTEKTSDNIMSSSVLELCKNDPKFVELIEVTKDKEKIAKESETQRKIFAKRQREQRRSTQGVKREDLEQALKMMEMAKNASSSTDTTTDIKKRHPNNNDVVDEEMTTVMTTNDENSNKDVAPDNNNDNNNDNDNDNDSCLTTAIVSLSKLRRSSDQDESEPTSSLTIKLPPRPPPPSSSLTLSSQPSLLIKSDSGQSINDEITTTATITTPTTPTSNGTTATTTTTSTETPTSPLSPSLSSTSNATAIKTTITTPADFARRRRIKRRSTGIEDDSGHALSPEILSTTEQMTTNPLTISINNIVNNDNNVDKQLNQNRNQNETSSATTTEKIDAVFDIKLNTPNTTTGRPSRIITRPVSNASSLSSLNQQSSSIRNNLRDSQPSSLLSSISSLAAAAATDDISSSNNISAASSINSLSSYDNNNNNNSNSLNYSRSNLIKNNNDNDVNNLNNLNSNQQINDITNSLSLLSKDEIDYKKLCKQLLRENEILRKRIKELEELDKKREQETSREKRSLQRNISEMEEELKIMNDIKADNMRLKDENAALIRVISKLSKN